MCWFKKQLLVLCSVAQNGSVFIVVLVDTHFKVGYLVKISDSPNVVEIPYQNVKLCLALKNILTGRILCKIIRPITKLVKNNNIIIPEVKMKSAKSARVQRQWIMVTLSSDEWMQSNTNSDLSYLSLASFRFSRLPTLIPPLPPFLIKTVSCASARRNTIWK